MNRPKKKDYPEVIKIINGVVTTYTSDTYEKDLEKYCDYMEWKVEMLADALTDYEKAFEIATEILDEQSGEGTLLCPQEWLGYCHCETTDSGYECEGDIDYANWKYCILEKIENIKDKKKTDKRKD